MITTVILWIDNLFSRAQFQQKIAHQFSQVQIVSSEEEAYALFAKKPHAVLVVDAENSTITNQFWQKGKQFANRIVIFYPHVKTSIAQRAKAAGLRHVYPRSQVFANPAGILGSIVEDEKLF